MIIPIPSWFGEYFEEHRNPPMSAWRVPHYYIYTTSRSSALVFFFNGRWFLDTKPVRGKAKEFIKKHKGESK